jgi:hypothetical protein
MDLCAGMVSRAAGAVARLLKYERALWLRRLFRLQLRCSRAKMKVVGILRTQIHSRGAGGASKNTRLKPAERLEGSRVRIRSC